MRDTVDSTLLRGLMEQLPPEGAVFPAERRQRWLALADNIFSLVYLAEQRFESDVPALPAPTNAPLPVSVEVVDARPTKFAARLSARKSALKARPAITERKEKPRKPGEKPTARDIILTALRTANRPLTVKEMVTVAETQCGMDLSGFRDVRAAVGFQAPRMDQAREIVLVDVSSNAKSYALPGQEKF